MLLSVFYFLFLFLLKISFSSSLVSGRFCGSHRRFSMPDMLLVMVRSTCFPIMPEFGIFQGRIWAFSMSDSCIVFGCRCHPLSK